MFLEFEMNLFGREPDLNDVKIFQDFFFTLVIRTI